jgi:hypothetical protein
VNRSPLAEYELRNPATTNTQSTVNRLESPETDSLASGRHGLAVLTAIVRRFILGGRHVTDRL